jgi:hypothetical protein
MTVQAFDREAAEQFAERMLGVVNGAAVTLMVSIGHRTGLFATMSELPPSTSAELAEAAGLQERYVREWLGALVTGGIVRYDAATRRYVLLLHRDRRLITQNGDTRRNKAPSVTSVPLRPG